MIISIDVEKHLASIKCKQEKACSITKATYEKPTANIIFNGNKTESFSSKIRNKDVCLCHFYSTQCQMFYPVQLCKKKKTRHPNWKEKSKIISVCRRQSYMQKPLNSCTTHTHTHKLIRINKQIKQNYRIQNQHLKLVTFLYPNNEKHGKMKLREKTIFYNKLFYNIIKKNKIIRTKQRRQKRKTYN